MFSFNMILDISAPLAEAMSKGIKAVKLMSINKTSNANKTPAMGALKAPAIPPAAPAASKSVRSR